MQNSKVFIVGAGPTGLAAAIEFARLGIPFRLIDKSSSPAEYSQALALQARSLEQFERYGIADTAVERGRPLKRASLISDGTTVISFPLDRISSRYPFVLFLPQNDTEQLLTEHLRTWGGEIERGTELVDITDRESEVVVQLRHADGQIETATSGWLIACDGAHSAVRDRLEIPFLGSTVSMNFFLGDLELEGPDVAGDELRVYLHRGDIVFIGRLSEKLFRVIVAMRSEHGEETAAQTQSLTLADFQAALDRAGIRVRAVSSVWMTPFHVNDRRAEQIRRGRVFLAGDASHIHSPVAGQGMNTGIQDVANLSWKIAAVERGADSLLLESYQEERGAVSEQLLRNTSDVLKMASSANLLLEKVRDTVLRLATRIPYVQDQILGFISETAINYHKSSAVTDQGGSGAVRAGDRIPNPDLFWKDGHRSRLLDALRIPRHLFIGLNVPNPDSLRRRIPRADCLFIDTTALRGGVEELKRIFGEDGMCLLVRPDGYVGYRGSAFDRDDLPPLDDYAAMMALSDRFVAPPPPDAPYEPSAESHQL